MHVTLATACEFATVDVTGRLNLSGIFSTWNVDQFPTVVTRFYLAAQLMADESSERDQSGIQAIKISCSRRMPPKIIDEQIMSAEVSIQLGKPNDLDQLPRYIPVYWPIFVAIDGLALPGPGLYTFKMSYKDIEVAVIKIGAKHLPVVKK